MSIERIGLSFSTWAQEEGVADFKISEEGKLLPGETPHEEASGCLRARHNGSLHMLSLVFMRAACQAAPARVRTASALHGRALIIVRGRATQLWVTCCRLQGSLQPRVRGHGAGGLQWAGDLGCSVGRGWGKAFPELPEEEELREREEVSIPGQTCAVMVLESMRLAANFIGAALPGCNIACKESISLPPVKMGHHEDFCLGMGSCRSE